MHQLHVPLKSKLHPGLMILFALSCIGPYWWCMRFMYMHVLYLACGNTPHHTDQLNTILQWWQCKVNLRDRVGLEQANYFTTSVAKTVHSLQVIFLWLHDSFQTLAKESSRRPPARVHRHCIFFGNCSFRFTIKRWIWTVHCLLHDVVW